VTGVRVSEGPAGTFGAGRRCRSAPPGRSLHDGRRQRHRDLVDPELGRPRHLALAVHVGEADRSPDDLRCDGDGDPRPGVKLEDLVEHRVRLPDRARVGRARAARRPRTRRKPTRRQSAAARRRRLMRRSEPRGGGGSDAAGGGPGAAPSRAEGQRDLAAETRRAAELESWRPDRAAPGGRACCAVRRLLRSSAARPRSALAPSSRTSRWSVSAVPPRADLDRAGPGLAAMPCLIAFSTSGWRNPGSGRAASAMPGSIDRLHVSRSWKRVCWISR